MTVLKFHDLSAPGGWQSNGFSLVFLAYEAGNLWRGLRISKKQEDFSHYLLGYITMLVHKMIPLSMMHRHARNLDTDAHILAESTFALASPYSLNMDRGFDFRFPEYSSSALAKSLI